MTAFSDRVQAALASGYTIERELTGGGMSHVFLATERALGRSVVVKVLPPDLAAGVNRDRFRREIALAAQLQHPHIVPLLTAGEHGDLLYYTMPYVSGESLRARLEQQGRLPVRDVVRILTDVVDALAYAHAHGVVHRDIKPGNVLTQRSHALVTDFGVAKALSAALPLAGSTTSGMAIGTPAYMAPEQLAADPAADHRVDLYAVGLLAYELLTGEAPFTGASPAATMAAQLTRDPEPIASRRPDVPAALTGIITRCLSKDPGGRPQSADILLAQLEDLPPDPSTRTRAIPAIPAPLSRRGLFLGGATLAVVVAAVAWMARGREAAVLDTGTATATAAVLTRADSMAIAEAVRRQMSRENARTERPTRALDVDSLTRAITRLKMDSLFRLNRTDLDERLSRIPGFEGRVFTSTPSEPPEPVTARGPRRVKLVATGAPGSAWAEAQAALLDSLRGRIGRMRGFTLAPTGPSTAESGEEDGEIVITVGMARIGRDSVRARIDLIDPLAAPSFIHRMVWSAPAHSAAPLATAPDLLSSAITTLAQMTRAPRGRDGVRVVVPDN